MAAVKKTNSGARKLQTSNTRRMGALIELDEKKAIAHLRKVFREADGSFMKAVDTLGCSVSAWYGWLRRLKLVEEFASIREEFEAKGIYTPNKGGRPKKVQKSS